MISSVINNEALVSEGRDVCPILNPVTGTPFDEFICATEQDADAAAEAAQGTLAEWCSTPAKDRGQVLQRIAQALTESKEQLARQITLEQGKPINEARLEMSGVVAMFEYFAQVAGNEEFCLDRSGQGVRRQIDMVPAGPTIVITTWNFPVETAAVHVAPALAAGCTVVVLANNHTPSSVAMLIEAMIACGLPTGAVNLVMGRSRALSARLIGHRATRHLSYTGSVDVGRVLASRCGAEIMRCTLELGGNAPAIVLPGTDVETAASALISKRFWNAGQVCTAPNRIYVNRDQHDEFAEAAGAFARDLVVGDGSVEVTTMGPLANAERAEAMNRIAADAISKGATAILNEPVPQNEGFFSPPRVLSNVPDDALGMSQEIFGPVACIAPYDDLEDIIARSNNCDLGLSGYVYGPDQEEAEAVGSRLEVGSVAVNQLTTAFIDVPFGGRKLSGLGSVGGPSALSEYLFPRLTAARL